MSKLSASGTYLVYSTFVGHSEAEEGKDILLDSTGGAYVTGRTKSTSFPTTYGVFGPSYSGSEDGFLLRLDASGSSLVFSSFLGGENWDSCLRLASDGSGSIYVAGSTGSADFPTTDDGYDTVLDDWEIFLIAARDDGTDVSYGTFLGGSGSVHGMLMDLTGRIYLGGTTSAPDFPTTSDAFDAECGTDGTCNTEGYARSDGFLMRIGSSLPDIWIEEIEINQALGRQSSDPPRFVARKHTVVRAFLTSDVEVNPLRQWLEIERDGVPVTTLYPTPSHSPTDVLTFECPTLEQCGHWEEGLYTFDVFVDGFGVRRPGLALFEERKTVRILAVPVKVSDRGQIKTLPNDDWKTSYEFLCQVYPVAYDGVDWEIRKRVLDATRWDLTEDRGRDRLLVALGRKQPLLCGKPLRPSCYEQIIGFMPPMPTLCSVDCDKCGCIEGWSDGGSVNVVMVNGTYDSPCEERPRPEIRDMQGVVAHEVGHTYGLGDEYNHPYGNYRCKVNPPEI